jgi:hypothetical protein
VVTDDTSPRRQKQQLNTSQQQRRIDYDEDQQEDSVFVKPFRIQKKGDLSADRSLLYRD